MGFNTQVFQQAGQKQAKETTYPIPIHPVLMIPLVISEDLDNVCMSGTTSTERRY